MTESAEIRTSADLESHLKEACAKCKGKCCSAYEINTMGYHTKLVEGLIIDPCIPADWQGFTVSRKWRGATYLIQVKNPEKIEKGVKSIRLNDTLVDGPIPIQDKNSINEIEVIMGN